MKIIFDFNRTLYDPETNTVVPDSLELLQELTTLGAELHLVSRVEPGREDAFITLGLKNFFTTVAFVPNKLDAIRHMAESSDTPVYVVGDYLHQEIRIGNRYNMKTIWLRRGKFSELVPENEDDVPWRTVHTMKEVRDVLIEDMR